MSTRIINPSTPGEANAAMSLSEDDAPNPYATIFYTVHSGRIRFFGLRVAGTELVPVDEGADPTERIVYFDRRGGGTTTTNPDEALVLISGTLENGAMDIYDKERFGPRLADLGEATDFVTIIRMVYNMEAQEVTA
jgi:hypothetical protein